MEKEELEKLEKRKKVLLRKALTKEALERLSNVKISNPVIASQLEMYLSHVYESGQLKDPIGDEQLKDILKILTVKKKTKIERK